MMKTITNKSIFFSNIRPNNGADVVFLLKQIFVSEKRKISAIQMIAKKAHLT